jgi:D-alanine transaminase
MQIAMVNDKILPMTELEPAYLDRGLFFGDGVYEVIRSYNGKLFALEEHLSRFARSLNGVRITKVDINVIRARVVRAFEAAGIANAKIYFHVTRGSGPRDHVPGADLEPNFFLTVIELEDESAIVNQGIAVSTYPDLRWARCDIKSLNLLPNVLARQDAAEKGCFEAILVDSSGLITEGAASAFFAVIGPSIRTAPLTVNILASVTRSYLIKAANRIRLEVVEKSLTVKQAKGADELFLAVTTKGIVPVVEFDGQIVSQGKPGGRTRQLIEEFRRFTG